MESMEYVKFIPLVPALGFLFNGLLGKRVGKKVVSIVGCGVILVSLILSAMAVADLAGRDALERSQEVIAFTWIPGFEFVTATGLQAKFTIEWGFLIDQLSAVMLFVVCFVGFWIHLYSTGYMAEEEGFYRFFAYLNLFMAMMLTLITANNMLVMFVGWEGVGLCSYLLIGYYYEKKSAADAGKKAFVVNRVGDYGMVMGTLFCLYHLGTVNFTDMLPMAVHLEAQHLLGGATITLICLLLFVGACGKSAQVPLYVWLPDAMEGPTPVSALIHAATMVTSGIYMIARLNPLFGMSPTAMNVIAVVGCVTAFAAATIAFTQTDIKKVLAYSTVSQLGYMFLALGVGAWSAAVFHLMTHAFFKACLFLGSGAVIYSMHHEQDMRKMGGLYKYIPKTYWTFFIATLAIAGIPGLAGFFSKDEILWLTASSGSFGLWFFGFLTAGMTSFYMFRLVYMTFHQNERFHDTLHGEPPHEAPWTMWVPLVVLAAGSVLMGYVGVPAALGGSNHWHTWLSPVLLDPIRAVPMIHSAPLEYGLMAASVALAGLAWWFARRTYKTQTETPKRFTAAFPRLYKGSLNKWYLDEIYDAVVINPLKKLTGVADLIDRWVIDGIVNGVRHLVIGVSVVAKVFDVGVIDMLVNLVAGVTRGIGSLLRRFQTGSLQNYAYYFILGLFFMVCMFLLFGNGAQSV